MRKPIPKKKSFDTEKIKWDNKKESVIQHEVVTVKFLATVSNWTCLNTLDYDYL